ncbi:hypothetical protein [Methylopila sp. M107]|uniref:hypothetical protein n=1 Tax=Methylopila sp. M107 TaxID=1101190 RepID=UPI000374A7BC|nr:hypothetical protein [Methylopila sp. M107]
MLKWLKALSVFVGETIKIVAGLIIIGCVAIVVLADDENIERNVFVVNAQIAALAIKGDFEKLISVKAARAGKVSKAGDAAAADTLDQRKVDPFVASQVALASDTAANSAGPNSAVVFGADRSFDAAKDEIRNAERLGFGSARIVERSGVFRAILPTGAPDETRSALERFRARFPNRAPYVVTLGAWCPGFDLSKSAPDRATPCGGDAK